MAPKTIQVTEIRGTHTIVASVNGFDTVRLSATGPRFEVVEIQVDYVRRDVWWCVDNVSATGFFADTSDGDWEPSDMVTILVALDFRPDWLNDFVVRHTPKTSLV